MIAVTPQMFFLVCPLVFLAAAVDAIGGGGGLISLPAYLLTGLPAALASGTNKCTSSVGSLTAMFKYVRAGRVAWKSALFAVAGAIPGAYLGAELLAHTPDRLVRGMLLVVIPLMAALLLVKKPRPRERELDGKGLALCLVIGLLVGFYDGFCGPGTGTVLIMLFTYLAGMDMVTASGSAKVVNLASNLAALAAHILNGNVLFALALPAIACSVAGGYLGAALALKKGAGFVRVVMLGVMALLVVKLALDLFS